MLATESQVKSIIGKMFSDRAKDNIHGMSKNITTSIAWYNGKTRFHTQKQIVAGKEVNKQLYHSGLGRLGASEWASLFLNEGLKISVPEEKGDEILQKILNDNKFYSRINSFGEQYFALGYAETLVKPFKIDFIEKEDTNERTIVRNAQNKVVINFVNGTRTYPISIEEGVVTECAIINFSTNKITIQVHLLDAKGEYVVGEVYGKVNTGGVLKLDFNTLKTWNTHSTTKLFQAWYPVKVDNEDLDNPLGTTINTSDAIDWIKAFDTAFDKFVTEYKNGGKRRYVSTELTYIDENGSEVPIPLGDEDVYLPPGKMGDQAPLVNEHSSELRAEAFIRGMQFFANMYGRSIGLGEDAFSIDSTGRPMQTATAAILKKNGAYRNVERNKGLAYDNIVDMCMAIKEIHNTYVEDGKLTYEREDVSVNFADNVIEDTNAIKQQALTDVNANIKTMWEYRAEFYDETEDEAKAFLQENGLLIDKYLPALQQGAMTPEIFVDMVYGANVNNKQALIDYITEHLSAPTEEPVNEDFEEDSEDEEEDEDDDE